MTYSVNLPPVYYGEFFSHFQNLESIHLQSSMVDDAAFGYFRLYIFLKNLNMILLENRIIGETCKVLKRLDASRTWMTDEGIKSLCVIGRNGKSKVVGNKVLVKQITKTDFRSFFQSRCVPG